MTSQESTLHWKPLWTIPGSGCVSCIEQQKLNLTLVSASKNRELGLRELLKDVGGERWELNQLWPHVYTDTFLNARSWRNEPLSNKMKTAEVDFVIPFQSLKGFSSLCFVGAYYSRWVIKNRLKLDTLTAVFYLIANKLSTYISTLQAR